MGDRTEIAEVQYLVLPDSVNPYLLARVRWPDVAHAISAGQSEWRFDPGLFDLPYDPSSATVTFARAASIAAGWGASLALDPAEPVPTLMRRMPPNWSNLNRAEKRAWSLELVTRRRGRRGRARDHRANHQAPAHGTALSESLSPVSNGTRLPEAPVAERRRHARLTVLGRVQIRCGQETITANLVDASEGGLHCIVPEGRTVPAVGGRIDSPLLLQDHTADYQIALEVDSRVAWHGENGSSRRIGVEFSDPNGSQLDQIERFLAMFDRERGS